VGDQSDHWGGMIRLDQQRQTVGKDVALNAFGPTA
jgi:hypothetical protein